MRALLIFAVAAAALRAQQLSKIEFKCNAEEGQVYLELVAADAIPGRIFITGNLHTDSATLYSLLLSSTDDGRTWTEPHERLPEGALEQIQFVDFQNGWISGQTVHHLPRDPFFLVTSDGGKTWIQRTIWEDSDRIGVVDRFFFENKDNGSMVVDLVRPNETGGRYQLYRTMTGGDSWALEQINAKPIALRRNVAASAWRVRADAKSKLFAVEKGGEGAWERVAAFPIEVAKCQGE